MIITTQQLSEDVIQLFVDGIQIGELQVERDEMVSGGEPLQYRRIALVARAVSSSVTDPAHPFGERPLTDVSIGATGARRVVFEPEEVPF